MRGIDYGNGMVNVDPKNGVRYGWISWHDLDGDVASELDMLARDAWYESNPPDDKEDEYPELDGTPTGERVTLEGVTVITLGDGVFVVASPYLCADGALCSPCAPGAVDVRTCERRHIPSEPAPGDDLDAWGEDGPFGYDVPPDWMRRD